MNFVIIWNKWNNSNFEQNNFLIYLEYNTSWDFCFLISKLFFLNDSIIYKILFLGGRKVIHLKWLLKAETHFKIRSLWSNPFHRNDRQSGRKDRWKINFPYSPEGMRKRVAVHKISMLIEGIVRAISCTCHANIKGIFMTEAKNITYIL